MKNKEINNQIAFFNNQGKLFFKEFEKPPRIITWALALVFQTILFFNLSLNAMTFGYFEMLPFMLVFLEIGMFICYYKTLTDLYGGKLSAGALKISKVFVENKVSDTVILSVISLSSIYVFPPTTYTKINWIGLLFILFVYFVIKPWKIFVSNKIAVKLAREEVNSSSFVFSFLGSAVLSAIAYGVTRIVLDQRRDGFTVVAQAISYPPVVGIKIILLICITIMFIFFPLTMVIQNQLFNLWNRFGAGEMLKQQYYVLICSNPEIYNETYIKWIISGMKK